NSLNPMNLTRLVIAWTGTLGRFGGDEMARLYQGILCVMACSVRLVAFSGQTPDGLEQCRSNLTRMYSAIQDYPTNNHRMPDNLDDLVPKYLPNCSLLKCPSSGPERNQTSPPSNPESISAGGYVYEFKQTPLTNLLAQSLGLTLQSWRQLQMGQIG